MEDIKKLEMELREAFPTADITNYGDSVSIEQNTVYNIDRKEITRLADKYKAGVWCDSRGNKVHHHFYSLRMWD
jgi:hypothetical protein